MNEAGILPRFKGVLCHDHWKPYYRYDCSHALCNAHHLRELEKAQIECPPPKIPPGKPKRGRLKRSKARNLLERLINYEDDVLRFMENIVVPFTNNRGENDIRMTKVHQKISGCFRSVDGAKIFCRVRGYLSTCRKQNISASEAMHLLFEGKSLDLFTYFG